MVLADRGRSGAAGRSPYSVRPWLNGGLLGRGELAEPLARLDGLPLRRRTLIPDATGPRARAPAGSSGVFPASEVELDPGFALGRLCRRWADDPYFLSEQRFWRPFAPEEAPAIDWLWRHSVAKAAAACAEGATLDVVRAALVERLELWAVAAIDPRALTAWFRAGSSVAREELEERWFGRSGVATAVRLAEGWGANPSLIDVISRRGRSDPGADPAWERARVAAGRSPWGRLGDGASRSSRTADDRKLLATVQVACEGGFDGAAAEPSGEELIRELARTRAELDLARRALAGEWSAAEHVDRERSSGFPEIARADLDALAEFAGGAAHELNNPLAVIAGRAQLLMGRTGDEEAVRSLRTIIQQSRRANQILRDLIYVARPPAPRPRPCSPRAILEQCVADHRAEAKERGVQVSLRAGTSASGFLADTDGLRHLADVLLRNAIEWTPRGGWVGVVSQDSEEAIRWSFDSPAAAMDDEAERKLFVPFFCGRQAGRGLGLGLPRASRWLERVGGRIRTVRGEGAGCRFEVWVPRASASQDSSEARGTGS